MREKKGPILLFLAIVILVLLGYFGRDILFKKKQKSTSDTSGITETINWAGDGYLGYSFLQTVEMKKQLARKGIALEFTNDNGDYTTRLEKFNDKEYDFIVLPVNSYLEHGAKYEYPGVIIAAICESKGADAIIGFEDVMPTGKVNDLNNPDLIIYYTGKSPSSFLLDLTISDFDLDELASNESWKREVNGSEEVFKMAKKAVKDRTIGDVFVMWEPEVSKAMNELGLKKLWGSDQFKGYIIDVFVFHRDFVSKKPEKIKDFLTTYFRVLDYYTSREEDMIKELSKISGIDKNATGKMIENLSWYSLHDNCMDLFEIPIAAGLPAKDGIVNSIYACSDVMRRAGTIEDDIEDPYLILNSTFLEEIKDESVKNVGDQGTGDIVFETLTEEAWLKLSEVGTIRVDPITFQSSTNMLDYQGEEIVDKVALMLTNNYPGYRILIKGHTGQGDEQENLILSQSRADVVRQRLIAVHSINPDRLFAKGIGASQPPVKKAGENPRAYNLRWARVEFILLESNSL